MRCLLTVSLLSLFMAGCGEVPGVEESCTGEAGSAVCEVLRIVNQERAAVGAAPYTWNAELALAAQRHAIDMVDNDYFSHDSLDGRNFVQRARDAGYDASPRGENIAYGTTSPEGVMELWMGSEGHRNNILSTSSNEIGVGFHVDHWVQVFGSR